MTVYNRTRLIGPIVKNTPDVSRAYFFDPREPYWVCKPPLPLPLGEVAERSEDGEGKRRKPLSVACGDSSPRGRAKWGALLPLPLGEVAERSEDGEGIPNVTAKALSAACGDSSPGGRAKGLPHCGSL